MTDKIKNIPEQKLKAFSIGTMGKRSLSKKELEEIRKKEEEKAAAHVFQEFVETFQETPLSYGSKVWVKAGTFDAGSRKEDTKDKGKLYKPQSRMSNPQELLTSAERAQAYAKLLSNDKKPERLGKKKPQTKSNLEAFMEELRQIQEEREERHKYKGAVKNLNPIESELELYMRNGDMGSFDNGDPTTTNLYLGNLNPKITEPQLKEIFGRFGPLASIKIMWPRSEEEKSRGRNCGFVAYMSRKDGERALKYLNGRDICGYEMKLGWGKSVIIPPHPIYIPQILLDISKPPPPSGLPFNAQPVSRDRDVLPKSAEELNQVLFRATVKVVIPNEERNHLMLIHRMVEFVVREGPMFEAMIMNREINNPQYRFLFENKSPAHIYYRWKLFSIMHGESQKEWSTKEFRMFKDGSIWKPPHMNSYTNGMPDELIVEGNARDSQKGSLSITQRDRLEDLIRGLTPEKSKIGDVMVFCIEHAEAAEEVVECIAESLSNESTAITKKIARFYLISDILLNCGVKVTKASSYRKVFQNKLIDIMKDMKSSYDKLEARLKADGFKMRVLRTLKAWEDTVYPKEFMIQLNNTFFGIEGEVEPKVSSANNSALDIDGDPLENHETDDEEVPMDGAALLKSALKQYGASPNEDGGDTDIDGEEIDEGSTTDRKNNVMASGFIASKWETVDPTQVEAQAMTTSKWDLLESSADVSQSSSQNDNGDLTDYSDARNMTEERRIKLREIEVKAVQYQDELESGTRSLKSGWTVTQQVEHYRRKLLRKSEKEKKEKEKEKEKHKKEKEIEKSERKVVAAESSEDEQYYKELTSRKSKKHARSSSSGSTSKHRSKSRSPVPRKRSSRASPSPHRSRRHSPSSTRSSRRARDSLSPVNSTNGKYSSPRVSRRYSTSPPPAKISRHSRYSPSPPPVKSSRHSRKSPSPVRSRRVSPSPPPRSRYYSPPSSSKKHRHKHKR